MTPLAALSPNASAAWADHLCRSNMRECLYHPVHGYYASRNPRDSLITTRSPTCIPFLAACWRANSPEFWEQLDRPSEFLLVEAAAGVGRLARHILEFAQYQIAGLLRCAALCGR